MRRLSLYKKDRDFIKLENYSLVCFKILTTCRYLLSRKSTAINSSKHNSGGMSISGSSSWFRFLFKDKLHHPECLDSTIAACRQTREDARRACLRSSVWASPAPLLLFYKKRGYVNNVIDIITDSYTSCHLPFLGQRRWQHERERMHKISS
jgi:hypothetical protein